jgi:hypothetical protein
MGAHNEERKLLTTFLPVDIFHSLWVKRACIDMNKFYILFTWLVVSQQLWSTASSFRKINISPGKTWRCCNTNFPEERYGNLLISVLQITHIDRFLCHLYGEVAIYRDYFSLVCCPSVTNVVWTTPHKQLMQFIQPLHEWPVPSKVLLCISSALSYVFLSQSWPFNNFHF